MVNLSPTDVWLADSFDEFNEATNDEPLGSDLFRIAVNAKQHEDTIRDKFAAILKGNAEPGFHVSTERSVVSGRTFIHDIVVTTKSDLIAVVEVKSPMTNHDGVRNKTRKPEHLPKDSNALRTALRHGAAGAYEFVTLIECYGLGADGKRMPVRREIFTTI